MTNRTLHSSDVDMSLGHYLSKRLPRFRSDMFCSSLQPQSRTKTRIGNETSSSNFRTYREGSGFRVQSCRQVITHRPLSSSLLWFKCRIL